MAEDVIELDEILEENVEFLWCPICGDKLEPTILQLTSDASSLTDDQAVWWTCRGVRTKSCDFPLWVPKEVFWTTRTASQAHDNVVPLPNFHLLPPRYQSLYPSLFKGRTRIRQVQKKPTSENGQNTTDHRKATQSDESVNTSWIDQFEKSKSAGVVRQRSVKATSRRLDQLLADWTANSTSAVTRLTRPSISALYEDPSSSTHLNDSEFEGVEYGNSNSRHKVKLFPDHKRALSSLISLKYAGDSFLTMLNSKMSRKKLVKPLPALGQKQRKKLLMSQQKKLQDDLVKNVEEILLKKDADKELRRYLLDAAKPSALTPKERKATEARVQKFIDSIIAGQSYRLSDDTITARLGTEHQPNERASSIAMSKSVNWSELGVLPSSQRAAVKETSGLVNNTLTSPLAASISSTHSSEQSSESFPEGHPLHIKSMGDEELDNLVRTNLVGLMRTGKLKKRRKRKVKPRIQTVPDQAPNLTYDPFGLNPIHNEVPQPLEPFDLLEMGHGPTIDDFPNLDFSYHDQIDDFGFQY